MSHVLSRGASSKPPTVVVIVNLGIMHQLPGGCNDNGGYARTLASFKGFLGQWYSSLPEGQRPILRGIVYGAPSVLGLLNVSLLVGFYFCAIRGI